MTLVHEIKRFMCNFMLICDISGIDFYRKKSASDKKDGIGLLSSRCCPSLTGGLA